MRKLKNKKIVVFCDGKTNGNTSRFLNSVLTDISTKQIEIYHIRDYQVAPCTGCLACKTGECIQKDDASFLLERVADADIVIVAAPIYFAGLPGALKAFADRMQVQFFKIYGGDKRPQKETKGFILSTQGSTDRRDSEAFSRSAKMLLNTLYCKAPRYFPVYGCDMVTNNMEGTALEAKNYLNELLEVDNDRSND